MTLHILIEVFFLAITFALLRWLWSSACHMIETAVELWRFLKENDDI